MIIRSKILSIIIAIVIFGGIMGASALGLWNTKSGRNPARIQLSKSVGGSTAQNTGTGDYVPADIRGNHSFSDISEMFGIPLETLSRAFALPAQVDPAAFRSQDFDSIYPEFEGEQEIGNGSIKWFVALYTSLPFELEDDEEYTYLLRPAVDILKSHAALTAEQIAYLDAFTIEIEVESQAVESNLPEDEPQITEEAEVEAENVERKQDEMVVVGRTTFADLLDWGISVEQIEAIIGAQIPNHLIRVSDYCAENGISFGGIKRQLQVEVDKLSP